MKLPKDGTDELLKDGCYWIALNVIFQGSKGQKNVKYGLFATFWQFSQKRSDKLFFIYFVCNFLGMISRSRDGFDYIIKKVTFKVGKVRFGPYSNNYLYYSVVMKCCPNALHHVNPVLKYERCRINLKCSGSERSNLDLCDLCGLISRTRCMVWPMFHETHTQSHI